MVCRLKESCLRHPGGCLCHFGHVDPTFDEIRAPVKMLNHHHGTPSNLEITHKKLKLSAGLFLDFQGRISAIIIVGVACKAANKIKQTTFEKETEI